MYEVLCSLLYLGDVGMHNQGGGQIMSPPSRHFVVKIMCMLCWQHILCRDTTRYNAGQTCASGTDNVRCMRKPVGAKTVPCSHSGTYSDARICNI